tara:strand:- start:934 stop:1683 length:750 start_codon:yes stop_codon:yes gene_type:complete
MKYKEEFIKGADVLISSNDSKYQAISNRYNEVKEVLDNILDEDIRNPFQEYCDNTYKDYPGKPMQPKPGKSPQKILNKVLKERFIEKGWDNETPIFYKDDEDLPEENKEFGNLRMDMSKSPIVMEASFNHGEAIEHNLFKLYLAISDTGITKRIKNFKLGVIIVPTDKLKLNANMDSVVGSYEKWKKYFRLYEGMNLPPYVLIGLKSFESFKVMEERAEVPKIKSPKTNKLIKDPGKKGTLLKVWTEDL